MKPNLPILFAVSACCILAIGGATAGCGASSGARSATVTAAAQMPAQTAAPASTAKSLFDGKSLKGWKDSNFAGGGEVRVEPDFKGQGPVIWIDAGQSLSGITFTNPVLKTDFEITVEALKIQGNDFFVGLTFPVGAAHATLVLGGWGGATTGISSIDGQDASENDTTKFLTYEKNKWYRIRIKVTAKKLETWLNDEKIVNQDISDRRISMRFGEIENSIPLGIATYQTTTVIRKVEIKPTQ